MDSVHDGRTMVHHLAGLGDGGLGADYGHRVDHWGDSNHGLVSHQDSWGSGGASQDGGESNLRRKCKINKLILEEIISNFLKIIFNTYKGFHG